jgi:hypothetical protein
LRFLATTVDVYAMPPLERSSPPHGQCEFGRFKRAHPLLRGQYLISMRPIKRVYAKPRRRSKLLSIKAKVGAANVDRSSIWIRFVSLTDLIPTT